MDGEDYPLQGFDFSRRSGHLVLDVHQCLGRGENAARITFHPTNLRMGPGQLGTQRVHRRGVSSVVFSEGIEFCDDDIHLRVAAGLDRLEVDYVIRHDGADVGRLWLEVRLSTRARDGVYDSRSLVVRG